MPVAADASSKKRSASLHGSWIPAIPAMPPLAVPAFGEASCALASSRIHWAEYNSGGGRDAVASEVGATTSRRQRTSSADCGRERPKSRLRHDRAFVCAASVAEVAATGIQRRCAPMPDGYLITEILRT